MKKTKSAKKAVLSGVALLALTAGVGGICALNSGNSTLAYADSQTLIEFTGTDSTATNGSLETINNKTVWKLDPTKASQKVTFNSAVSLGEGTKKVQFRMYIHWGSLDTSTGETNGQITLKVNDQDAGYFGGYQWSGSINNAFRPLVQDEWMTLTLETNATSISSLGFDFNNTGITAHSDAYILVDKVSLMTASPAKGENVVTEFAWDEVDYNGKGWRTDLASDVDTDNNGVVEAENALRLGITQAGLSLAGQTVTHTFPSAISLSNKYGTTKGLQFRMYLHLGEITGAYNIEVYLNGGLRANWASEADGNFDTTRPIIQDQWITFTLPDTADLTELSSIGFKFPSSGINYHQDSYILIDKITTVEDSAPLGENVVTEFAVDQINHTGKGWRTDLIKDVDTNGDGNVDAKNAWRVNLDTGVASTGITFANALDLSQYAGFQFRVYVHWGTTFGAESQLSLCANTAKPAHAYDGVFALWKGKDQADRPMKQDEWITFTVVRAAGEEINSLSSLGIYITPDGVQAYDDAYILIDKIVGIPKTAETHGENVITEFAANEVSHAGQGWRTDLVTEMDEVTQGATNAFRFDPHYSDITFTLAKGYDMTGVKALQFRMYMHIGDVPYATGNPTIGMYANGTDYFVNWTSESAHRKFVQDEWFTFTVTNELNKFGGTFNSLKISFAAGGYTLPDDAYILIDNITAVKETTNGEGVLTEFAADQVTHKDIGWCSDFASNVDTDGDGNIDAENAYRLNLSPISGEYPSLVFTDPISLSSVKSLHLRMFVRWGEISSKGAGIVVKAKNGEVEKDLVDMSSADKIRQDEWLDIYLAPDEVASLVDTIGDSITGIVVQKINEANVSGNDNAYILFDKMYENKYTVTFNHGDDLGIQNVEVSEGLTVTAPESKKDGHSVKWYYMNGDTKVYYSASATVNSNVTYEAEYTINKYTVTFDHPEGYTDKQVEVDWNGKVSADASEAACQEVGKNVVWKDEAGNVFDFNTQITADTTLHATYTTNTYTVTFDHGTEHGGTRSQTVEHGGKATAQASLNEAYNVTWYTDAEFTTAYDFNTAVTGALTLYGKYEIKKFDVTFVHGDGIQNEVVEDVEYGAKVEAKASKKTGYTVKWYKNVANNVEFNFDEMTITEATTIYAVYTPIEYTVTYKYGDAVLATRPVNYDATAPNLASTNPGHTVKWYTDAACENEYNFATTTISGDLTLYAKYTIETFTVTFKHESGDVTETVDWNTTVTAAASTKPGHSVKWYYMDGEQKVYFDFDAGITANYVLQPEYKVNTYVVTFNHGDYGTQTVNANYGSTVARPDSKDDTNTHNVEWYTDAEFTTAYDFDTKVTGALTLYGKYVLKTYTVTFVHGNNIADEVVENVEHGSKVEAKASKQEGYTVKWYADEAHTTEFDFAADAITADTTIYAVYTIKTYTVTVVLGGDAENLVLTVNHGATANLSGAEKEGYTVALYTDEAMTQAFTANTPVTGNITLYAKYTLNKTSGCGGEVGVGGALLSTAMAGAVLAGALIIRKKKEDD